MAKVKEETYLCGRPSCTMRFLMIVKAQKLPSLITTTDGRLFCNSQLVLQWH